MAAVISGVVRDPGGKAVANARVAFTSAPVAVPDIAALTDSRGGFALSAPAPGTYVVECFAEGFLPLATSVHVAGSTPVHVVMQLVSSPPGAT